MVGEGGGQERKGDGRDYEKERGGREKSSLFKTTEMTNKQKELAAKCLFSLYINYIHNLGNK